jgi:hypothetical protein
MKGMAATEWAAGGRLFVIEHKAMIQPPTEAVHHKPVFLNL